MEINSGPLTFIQVGARGHRVGEREDYFCLIAVEQKNVLHHEEENDQKEGEIKKTQKRKKKNQWQTFCKHLFFQFYLIKNVLVGSVCMLVGACYALDNC